MPEWTAVQALWRRAFGVKNDRELPCEGRFFIRKQQGFVSMCRVHGGELWDVCTHEEWRNQGHATAVCEAAIEWAAPKRLRAVTDCTWKAAWYRRMGCNV